MPQQSLLGWWYATGPEDRDFNPNEPDVAVYRVVGEKSDVPGCLLIEGPCGARFPVARTLVLQISRPASEFKDPP